MKISWTELYSDDLPNEVVDDYIDVMHEEAEKIKRDRKA